MIDGLPHARILLTLDSIAAIKVGQKVEFNDFTECFEPTVSAEISSYQAPINWVTEQLNLGHPTHSVTQWAIRNYYGQSINGTLYCLEESRKKLCQYINRIQKIDIQTEEDAQKVKKGIATLTLKVESVQAGILRLETTYKSDTEKSKSVHTFYDSFTETVAQEIVDVEKCINTCIDSLKPDSKHGISPRQIALFRQYEAENKHMLTDSPNIYYPTEMTGLPFPFAYYKEHLYIINNKKTLGSGNFKSVFSAVRLHDILQFACSVTKPTRGAPETLFIQENAMATLFQNRPGLLNTICCWQVEECYCQLMTYYELGPLNLDRECLRSAEEILSISKQLIVGLATLHIEEVVHSDLKPENIFLTEKDDGPSAVIADFGGINFDDAKDAVRITNLMYMSPESFANSEIYEQPRDVWALGCILWRLITKENVPWITLMIDLQRKCSMPELISKATLAMQERLEEPEKGTFLHLVWQMVDPNPKTRIKASTLQKQASAIQELLHTHF